MISLLIMLSRPDPRNALSVDHLVNGWVASSDTDRDRQSYCHVACSWQTQAILPACVVEFISWHQYRWPSFIPWSPPTMAWVHVAPPRVGLVEGRGWLLLRPSLPVQWRTSACDESGAETDDRTHSSLAATEPWSLACES